MTSILYLHDLSPFLVRFSGNFGVRWYGLAYLAGFSAAYLIIFCLAKKGIARLKPDRVGDFVFAAAVGCLAGGRLGYLVFYDPELFLSFRSSFPFWGALAVNEGGMASHGGMLGVGAACLIFARREGVSALHLIDLCAITSTIGIFFGRLANFVNGELLGRAAGPGAPFRVLFPQELLLWLHYEPKRLLSLPRAAEAIGIDPENWRALIEGYPDRGIASLYSALERMIAAVQAGSPEVKSALVEVLTPRHPSQLYAAALEGLLLFLFLLFMWRKPRRPGFITGLFMCGYSMVRVADECFRMPDVGIGYQLMGLTRGQILSLFLFAGGLALLRLSRGGACLSGRSPA